MRQYILLSFSIACIVLVSCKKETKIPTSGTVTISSRQIPSGPSYVTYGLSFSAGALHKYPGQAVDVILLALKPTGDITALFFTAPDYYTGNFNNSFYSSNADSAEVIFNNYTDVTVTDFQPITDTLKVGQIISYKNASNQYAKMLIKNIDIIKTDPPYAEVTVQWAFQANGTNKF
jgi:hypothetical protein